MHYRRTAITAVLFTMVVFAAAGQSELGRGRADRGPGAEVINVPGMSLVLHYGNKASITSLILNGQPVISGDDGICTSVTVDGVTYSSLHLLSAPELVKGNGRVELRGIRYGDKGRVIDETWIFTTGGVTAGSTGGSGGHGGSAVGGAVGAITWEIQRRCSTALTGGGIRCSGLSLQSSQHLGGSVPGLWRPGLVLPVQ
jgi:hypothetical protein